MLKAYKDGTKVKLPILKISGTISGKRICNDSYILYDISYNENGRYSTVQLTTKEFELANKDNEQIVVEGYKRWGQNQ